MSYGRRFKVAAPVLSLESAEGSVKTDADVVEGTTPPADTTPAADVAPAADAPAADAPAADTTPAADAATDAAAADAAADVVPAGDVPAADVAAAELSGDAAPAADAAADPAASTDPVVDPAADADAAAAAAEATAAVDQVAADTAAVDAPAVDAPAADAAVTDAPAADAAPVDVPTEDLTGVEVSEILENPEIMEAEDGFDETTQTADAATDTAENLENIATQLEGTLEEGGALPQTIAVAEIAVESYIKDLTGRKPTKRTLLSLESYGGLQSRKTATRLAMENIREVAAQAWAKIIEMVKKAMEFLKGMVDQYVTGLGKFKEQNAKLMEALRKNGANAKAVTIKVKASVANKLKLGGQFSKEALMKGIANMKAFLAKVLKFLGANTKTVDGVDVAGVAQSGEFPTIDASMLAQATRAFGSQKEQVEEGIVTVTNMEPLPGDATAHVTGPDVQVVGDRAYRAVSSQDINISYAASENEEGDVEIPGMTVNDLGRACNGVDDLIKMLEELNAEAKSALDVEARMLNEASQASKSTDEGIMKTVGAKLQGFVSRASRALARPVSVVARFARNVIGTILILVSSAMATLGILGLAAGAKAMPDAA